MGKWKDSEIQYAIRLIKEGNSYEDISELLNRTRQSVRVKLNKLGYYVDIPNCNVEKQCLNCCESFISLESSHRKFCSLSCSATYNNKRRLVKTTKPTEPKKENKPKKNKYCPNCDNLLKNQHNIYCSVDCVIQHKQSKIFDLIESGNTELNSRNYKKYLIHKHGEKCMECGWCEINPHTGNVPIELEHIDGDSSNNSLDNLKLLCPNCHSLTSTYKALNKGNGRHYRRERYKEGKSF
jgi:hypothetical protein